jgi:hypothetical protein
MREMMTRQIERSPYLAPLPAGGREGRAHAVHGLLILTVMVANMRLPGAWRTPDGWVLPHV